MKIYLFKNNKAPISKDLGVSFYGDCMGKWIYRKQEPPNVRGLCVKCGNNPQKSKGNGKYKPICSPCDKRVNESKSRNKRIEKYKRPYITFKKNSCERCGFIPEHSCQLDVDHIDGNHKNNEESNLQTLCANCHRLKTYQKQDWKTNKPQEI